MARLRVRVLYARITCLQGVIVESSKVFGIAGILSDRVVEIKLCVGVSKNGSKKGP